MTEADRIFSRFPEFIREYIFTHRWESLRGVQVAAARTLFLTDHHLLLTSSTASGKTEAAFFPILSDLCENPPMSVGALYICGNDFVAKDNYIRDNIVGIGIVKYLVSISDGFHAAKFRQIKTLCLLYFVVLFIYTAKFSRNDNRLFFDRC